MHKAGFVNIVGNPNVGKSTLMNLLVGERISIATFKAQTTRHRIMGILNTDEMQIVLSVISNRELPRLEKVVHEIDPECFMVVSRVTEVQGRGFSMKKQYQ